MKRRIFSKDVTTINTLRRFFLCSKEIIDVALPP
jgi:hypothetical protein